MDSFDNKTHMTTLSEMMNKLKEKGFTEEFVVKDNLLRSTGSDEGHIADDVKILNFYRFEGESDPMDNSILYAVETANGTKGLLTDAYGAYADEGVSKFVQQVEEISKRAHHKDKTDEKQDPAL